MAIALNQKNWNDPNKILARTETIISPYKRLFGHNLPEDKHYWSMCEQCSTPNGTFQEGCELDQILKEDIISVNQFHGVDWNEEITEANRNANPDANWYHGDFQRTMSEQRAKGNFDPAVINADFTSMQGKAMPYIASILNLASYYDGELMVICNMVLGYQRFPDRMGNIDLAIEKLNELPMFRRAKRKCNWEAMDNSFYEYGGTGDKHSTKMASIIFYKEA